MRDRNAEFVSQQQVREIGRRSKQVDSMDFFNLITGPGLLDSLEALMPEYRERKFSPTMTLAMFLGQVLRADSSCRNAVNEAIVNQLLQGSEAVSASTGGYCQARERLPIDLVHELARRCGLMLNQHTSNDWLWRGRHVKLTDGTTTLMPDTEQNQARYPQHGSQEPGEGFPIARLVAVMSLANGAVLDLAMGPYKGKGTGEYWPVRRSTRHRYAASASNPSRRAYSAIETPDPCHARQCVSHIALIVARCSCVNMPSSFASVQVTCQQKSEIYGRAYLSSRLLSGSLGAAEECRTGIRGVSKAFGMCADIPIHLNSPKQKWLRMSRH